MKATAFVLVACLASSAVLAQTAPRIRAIQPAAPAVQVSPAVAPASTAAGVALPKDYEALYQKEAEKTRALRAEVASLTTRLAEMTRPGGSLVQAYCETPTMSRNTAGASNDCATAGYGCEPVSGLCRTSATSSMQCATGFVYCATNSSCVNSAAACP